MFSAKHYGITENHLDIEFEIIQGSIEFSFGYSIEINELPEWKKLLEVIQFGGEFHNKYVHCLDGNLEFIIKEKACMIMIFDLAESRDIVLRELNSVFL